MHVNCPASPFLSQWSVAGSGVCVDAFLSAYSTACRNKGPRAKSQVGRRATRMGVPEFVWFSHAYVSSSPSTFGRRSRTSSLGTHPFKNVTKISYGKMMSKRSQLSKAGHRREKVHRKFQSASTAVRASCKHQLPLSHFQPRKCIPLQLWWGHGECQQQWADGVSGWKSMQTCFFADPAVPTPEEKRHSACETAKHVSTCARRLTQILT